MGQEWLEIRDNEKIAPIGEVERSLLQMEQVFQKGYWRIYFSFIHYKKKCIACF